MSQHFTRGEFIRSKIAEDRRIDNNPPPYISKNLEFTMAGAERVRAALGHPMIISSGYRCPEVNALAGGAPNSQHMQGEAFDFTCPGFGTPPSIVNHLRTMLPLLGIDQLILEPGWVHVSFTMKPRYQVLDLT